MGTTRKDTQLLINRARGHAEQRLRARHPTRYTQLRELEVAKDKTVHSDLLRSRVLTQLRREFRWEWQQLKRETLEVVRREAGWVDGVLSRDPDAQVTCPLCHVGPGAGCLTNPGRNKTRIHAVRRQLAQATRVRETSDASTPQGVLHMPTTHHACAEDATTAAAVPERMEA